MVSIPNISVANPRKIVPVSFFFLVFPNISMAVPTRARTGVKDVGFKSCINRLSLEIPPRLRIQAVTVVPTLAPMITWIACPSVISPEFTKPTTITVVAEELWMIEVTPRPVRKPAALFCVSLPRSVFRLFPALLSRESPITFIPKRNRHKPPISVRKSKMFISSPHTLSSFSHVFDPFI